MENNNKKRFISIVCLLIIIISILSIIVLQSQIQRETQIIRPRAQNLSIATPTPRASFVPNFVTPTPNIVARTPAPTNSSTPQVSPISPNVPLPDPPVFMQAGLFTISGVVYVDSDRDHIFDWHEQGYGGAEVKLIGETTRTIRTLASGAYSYPGLSGGVYSVVLTPPSGYEVSTANLSNFRIGASRRHDIGMQIDSDSTAGSTGSGSSSSAPAPQQAHYYVSTTGSDSANGSSSTPFLTIQKAVNVTKTDSDPGAVIHVLPGTYREAVAINTVIGTVTSPVVIKAENGPDSVFILGSESSQDTDITWAQNDGGLTFPAGVSTNIYRADISSWNATPEMAFSNDATITRLPKAHEPDYGVTTEWKHHQNWWKADGVVGVTEDTLVDETDDTGGSYPEAVASAGNLGNINGITSDFLAGARLFAKDTHDGHDTFTETIATHDASEGTITLDDEVNYYSGEPAFGEYTKYYIEGKPELLDEEGEWYFDPITEYLYIWPEDNSDPADLNLEFAVRNTAINIRNSAYVTIKDLNLQFTNYAYSGVTGPDGAVRFFGFTNDITHHITMQGLKVRHNGVGLRLYQSNADVNSPGTLSYVRVEDSLIEHSDSFGMMVWHFPLNGPTPFINNIWLENNEFGHMGFRGAGPGLFMQHPEKIVAINNHFHHSAHNNVDIQQGKATGNSYFYFANNLFEDSCFNANDCGGLKILNSDPGTGSGTILVTHNIFRGTKGWSYAAEVQGDANSPFGYGYSGFGYYSDVVEGTDPADGCSILLYRNISLNNSAGGIHYTRSRDQCAFNNVLSQNGVGIHMNNYGATVDGSFGNIVRGNIIQHAESGNSTNADIFGIVARLNKADEDELEVDYNRYQISGANTANMFKQDISFTNVGTFTSVDQIRANTPWEDNGRDLTSGTIGITTEDHYEISTIENSFGVYDVEYPAESVSTVLNLEAYYGIDITNGSTVGRLP